MQQTLVVKTCIASETECSNQSVSSFMSRPRGPTSNRSIQRGVFPGNHLLWFWQL